MTNLIEISPEKLLYPNQFILGSHYVERLSSWQRVQIKRSIYITAHPDLKVNQIVCGDKSLTLLGFMLDPQYPEANNLDILNTLIGKLSTCDTFFEHTYTFGGRWILIVDDGKEIRLFNDAVGLRQVFYTDVGMTGELWCASQPGIIAELCDLQMDSEAIDFIDSYEFRTNPEFRWPGNSSPYKEIKHLLPNHYLNLKTGRCFRYWPDKPLTGIKFNEALERTASILQGLMKSAAYRFDLAISITAGLDSRVVLAASKPISDSVYFMTVRQIGKPENHPDVRIPFQILSRLGLKHDVVKSSLIMDDEFVKVFKKNVPVPHYIYAPDAQAILNYYGKSKVAVTGSTSEVSRSSFRALLNKPLNEKLTIWDFASLQNMGKNQFALSHYEVWLSTLGNIYNLDVLNLFEWELDDGNWLANCQLEFDIAWRDIFTPFNCRDLIITILSVEKRYMQAPEYEFHKGLILKLWPEVLSFPVNPHKNKKKGLYTLLKSYVRNRLSMIF